MAKSSDFPADLQQISEDLTKSLEDFVLIMREAAEKFQQTVANFDQTTVGSVRKALAQISTHPEYWLESIEETTRTPAEVTGEQRHESL